MPLFNTVLLVDDDYVNNFLTEKLLKKEKITDTVKSVRNGEEALTYLSEPINKIPDLILLDINMPEMDGIEFLKYFKRMILENDIKVILLTAAIDSSTRKRTRDLGFPSVIEKPFTLSKLKDSLLNGVEK